MLDLTAGIKPFWHKSNDSFKQQRKVFTQKRKSPNVSPETNLEVTYLKVIYTCMLLRNHETNSTYSLCHCLYLTPPFPPAVQTASGSSLFVPVGCHSVCPVTANLSITIRTVRAWLTFRYPADTHTCSYVTPPPSESGYPRLKTPDEKHCGPYAGSQDLMCWWHTSI